jgi:3'-phosphoadenosine 5'-phosphosulfate sulfotransferase (PAPS reductase)/FAD synthetase
MLLLLKAHVKGHMRAGVFIKPHEDKRRPQVLLRPGEHVHEHQLTLFNEELQPAPPTFHRVKPTAGKQPVPIAPGPDLASYDKVLVGFSGGKDSIAAVLALLENGVPPEKIELHHHDIDGEGATFMDWPVTKDYCRKFAAALGIPIYFSWRKGGFEREMMRDNQRTAPVAFEKPDGTVGEAGGQHGPLGTRKKFPQQSANLTTRWCSGALKVDVMAAAIRNQDRFDDARTLVVTGERAEESSNRAHYKTFEPHRAHSSKRHVDQYRPVHAWSEQQVWDVMREHGVVPHPSYQLGYGRLSCRHCIFANQNQIATNQALYPESTGKIAAREQEFGITIHRKEDLMTRAKKGTPYQAALDNPEMARLGDSTVWDVPIIVPKEQWKLPAGAFGEKDGPC